MRKTLFTILLVALAGLSFGAFASEATVKSAFSKKYPEVTVESVVKTPVAGIYEVFANGQMLYADETASYIFINANLVDTDKKSNLTEERMSKLTAIKFSDLPLNLAVKRVKGKGTRKLAYFGDPNCGYCKKFEQDLKAINEIGRAHV